jgi:hypothetical protein
MLFVLIVGYFFDVLVSGSHVACCEVYMVICL